MLGQTNGGVFNPKNLGLFSYTYNNSVSLVDENGESPESALLAIQKHRKSIHASAKKHGVSPYSLGAIHFQEKYWGVLATGKNALSYIIDGGVNDNTSNKRSYGFMETQLKHAINYLGLDPKAKGSNEKAYNALQDEETAIDIAAWLLKKETKEFGGDVDMENAGYLHNMGAQRYKDYLDPNYEGEKPNDRVPKRVHKWQSEIKDAVDGKYVPAMWTAPEGP